MKMVFLLSNDLNFLRSLNATINKEQYEISNPKVDVTELYSYCCSFNPDIIIIHSSYLNSYYRIFDMLVNKKIICIYYSNINEVGLLYNVISNPRFNMFKDINYQSINDVLSIIDKNINIIDSLEANLDKIKEKIEEDRLIKRAKLKLIASGMSEEEAYKLILKNAMDKRISKASSAKEFL